MREEIHKLVNELVELEYKDFNESLANPKPLNLPIENDYFGISKFSSVQFHLPPKRTVKSNYIDTVRNDMNENLFRSDTYLEGPTRLMLDEPPRPNNTCNCLKQYYDCESHCP